MLRNNRYVRALCVLSAVMSAGCVKYAHEPESGGDVMISFPTPVISRITKADNRSTYPETSSFGVFGLYCPKGSFSGWERTPGSSVYMDGVEFKYDGSIDDATPGKGGWISDPAYYWPRNARLTFAAWSPYSVKDEYGEGFSYGAAGLSIKRFSTGPNDGIDLMYSERVYDKSSGIGSNSVHDGVDLVFHHALAALSFKAQSAVANVKVAIDRIVLWGICSQGDFSENVKENATSATTYSSEPAWSGLSGKYTEQNPLSVSGDMFIIPQEIGDDVQMKVYYTVQVGDSSPVPAVSKPVKFSGQKRTDNDSVLDRWEMAHRYVYTLNLGVQQIRFSVDVSPWGGTGSDLSD